MNTIKYRALAKDGGWRYGEYPHMAPEMSNTHYSMEVFWRHFPQLRRGTLGQYTGLQDKHGKPIYEGDILKGVTTLYPVTFNEAEARFEATLVASYIPTVNWCRKEVIGNVYEHPDLLEKAAP